MIRSTKRTTKGKCFSHFEAMPLWKNRPRGAGVATIRRRSAVRAERRMRGRDMGHTRLDIIYLGGAAERESYQFAEEASKAFQREFEIEPLALRYFRAEDGIAASEIPLVPEAALSSLSLIHPL